MLHSNDEQYTVPLNQLETIDGLPLTKETVVGTEVVWLHKGKTPYKATIVRSDGSTAMDEGVKGIEFYIKKTSS